MHNNIFGTDGIRGKVGHEPIISSSLIKIGYCFAKEMFSDRSGIIVIGHDGRESSDMIIKNLSIGILAQGSKFIHAGIIPTASLAIYLNSKSISTMAGIQITASHNIYKDNGMKFFDHHGKKISQINEKSINNQYHNVENIDNRKINNLQIDSSIKKTYIEFIKKYISNKLPILNKSKKKLSLICDCANGALSECIEEILDLLPVKYSIINYKPNGRNINDNCGSTQISNICDFVSNLNNNSKIFDLGVSFDGDGDRAIFIDENCKIYDGDSMVFLLSKHLLKTTEYNKTSVGTLMTNYGIRNLYKNMNINFIETEVGDKNVFNEIKKHNAMLGGESSGHIIINNNNFSIGDGIISLLHVIEMLITDNKNLSCYGETIKMMPSKLLNIKVNDKNLTLSNEDNKKLINQMNEIIKDKGRLLIRASGTEDVIRVLIEHIDTKQLDYLLNYFCDKMKKY